MNSTRSAALWYAGEGWPILPIWPIRDGKCLCGKDDCERPGKHPMSRFAKNGFKNATLNAAIINKWWDHFPDANLATCKWFRIDVDTKENGLDNWRELIYGHDPFESMVVKTPSGGLHYYFQFTKTHGNSNQEGDLPPGIDVRGNMAGYTLLPPSNHLDGRYEWSERHPRNLPILPAPQWLYDLVGPDKKAVDGVEFGDEIEKPDLNDYEVSGVVRGCISGDRSRIDQGVITSLVRAGATDNEILGFYKHYPIGTDGKYAEKSNAQGDKYLALSIAKARNWLGSHTRPERSQL